MKTFLMSAGLVVASLGSTAQAYPGGTDKFVHEASGYVVETRDIGGGRRLLRGRHPVTGQTFRVTVAASGRTTGTFEGQPVAFIAGQARDAEMAVRATSLGASAR